MIGKGLVTALISLAVFATDASAMDKAFSTLPFAKRLTLATAGDNAAKLAVGESYETANGVKLNILEAAKWYRQAALAGQLEAQYRLALIIEKGGPGLKPDLNAARKLLQAAANKGHGPSQLLYGQRLYRGEGIAKDEKIAAVYIRKAAEQGLAVAQNVHGSMLLHGWGQERNLDEAFKWFTKAADQGDLLAMNNLGGMFENGWGTAKDQAKAVEQYQRSAAKGNEIARKNLERLGLPLPPVSNL